MDGKDGGRSHVGDFYGPGLTMVTSVLLPVASQYKAGHKEGWEVV